MSYYRRILDWILRGRGIPEITTKLDLYKLEHELFPYGKIGDIRYDINRNELVMITQCAPLPHDETAEDHKHVYHPTELKTPWGRTYKVWNPYSLVPLSEAEQKFKEQFEKE